MESLKLGFIIERWLTTFYLVLAGSLLWPSHLMAGAEKVPAEVSAQVIDDEAVPVLVGLKVPWQVESTLSDSAISLQRQAITIVQNQLLSELSGTQYKLVRRYDVIPGLALEVSADALAILEKSNNVINVLPDRPAKPAASSPTNASTESARETGSVPQELFKEAARDGTVLVLVGLKAPWSPEGPLSENLISAQREAIAAAQNYLLAELADTHYRITRRYHRIPGIALEVGLDALRVLAVSVAVTNVLQDRPTRVAR